MIKQEIGISDCTVGAGIPIESKPLLTLKEASRSQVSVSINSEICLMKGTVIMFFL